MRDQVSFYLVVPFDLLIWLNLKKLISLLLHWFGSFQFLLSLFLSLYLLCTLKVIERKNNVKGLMNVITGRT